jgi:hypothetical protein
MTQILIFAPLILSTLTLNYSIDSYVNSQAHRAICSIFRSEINLTISAKSSEDYYGLIFIHIAMPAVGRRFALCDLSFFFIPPYKSLDPLFNFDSWAIAQHSFCLRDIGISDGNIPRLGFPHFDICLFA